MSFLNTVFSVNNDVTICFQLACRMSQLIFGILVNVLGQGTVGDYANLSEKTQFPADSDVLRQQTSPVSSTSFHVSFC